ncbi:hypothetical protein [uncultured Ferrimonas sp.]|uniref:hypothetical protein n=1 Tax=uncultured Ferrimonas sp. TaxID=432640 RepID=UPI00263092D0|nr:hypothetical protein [uncultured Ferrimonas sp.]
MKTSNWLWLAAVSCSAAATPSAVTQIGLDGVPHFRIRAQLTDEAGSAAARAKRLRFATLRLLQQHLSPQEGRCLQLRGLRHPPQQPAHGLVSVVPLSGVTEVDCAHALEPLPIDEAEINAFSHPQLLDYYRQALRRGESALAKRYYQQLKSR